MAQRLSRYYQHMERLAEKIGHVDVVIRHQGLDGEGVEGLYGSISFASQLALAFLLIEDGHLPNRPSRWVPGREPVMVDFGAGTGRALVLWQALNLIHRGFGLEFDSVKVFKAQRYLVRLLAACRDARLPLRPDTPIVLLANVAQVRAGQLAPLRPTLGYSFWVGLGADAKGALGDAFLDCHTMQVLVVIGYSNTAHKVLPELAHNRPERQGEMFISRTLPGMAAMSSTKSYSAFVVCKTAQQAQPQQQAPVQQPRQQQQGQHVAGASAQQQAQGEDKEEQMLPPPAAPAQHTAAAPRPPSPLLPARMQTQDELTPQSAPSEPGTSPGWSPSPSAGPSLGSLDLTPSPYRSPSPAV